MSSVQRILLPMLAVACLTGVIGGGGLETGSVSAAPPAIAASSFAGSPVHPICPIGSWRATNLADYLSGFFPASSSFSVITVNGGLGFTFRDDFTFHFTNDNIEVIGNIALPSGSDPLLVVIQMTGSADGTYAEDSFGHLAMSNVTSGFVTAVTVNGESIGPGAPTLAGGIAIGGVYTCDGDNMTYTPDLTGPSLTSLVGPLTVPGGGAIPAPTAGTLRLFRTR